jgi:hypothetical protein
MKQETIELLDKEFARFPVLCSEGVTKEEIALASQQVNLPVPPDLQAFLLRYGGAIVGPFPIFGLRRAEAMNQSSWNIIDVNQRFHRQHWHGIETWLIVSIDHAGNLFGIAPDERVWLSDHDTGETVFVADSFEEFIHSCLAMSKSQE